MPAPLADGILTDASDKGAAASRQFCGNDSEKTGKGAQAEANPDSPENQKGRMRT